MNARYEVKPLGVRGSWALAGVLAAALAIRLADLWLHPRTDAQLAPDQGYTVDLARLGWSELIARTAADTHPPLYYMLVKLWYALTPDTLRWAQMLSLLFAAGSLYLTFRLARDLFSRPAGWLALVSAALAPYQIYWHQAARNHLLLPPAAALVVWLSYRLLERLREEPDRGHRGLWLALCAAWVLAVQTNYMGLVFGVTWGAAFLLAERAPLRARVRLALAPLAALLTLAPWAAVLMRQAAEGPMNVPFFQETVSPVYLYYHAVFGTMDRYQPDQSGAWFVLGMLAFAAVAVAGGRAVGTRWSWWLLLILAPTLPIVIAATARWTLAERHLLFALPLFMAHWGAGLEQLWLYLRRSLAPRHSGAEAAAPADPDWRGDADAPIK